MRKATVRRSTKETDISVKINIDGTGEHSIATGVGFFDHMLEQLSRHSLIDIEAEAKGDFHIDDHHTVEDVGIALGQAVAQALANRAGITRYGYAYIAMDEALTRTVLDISGRPWLVWNVKFPTSKIGNFDTELVREFFQAFAQNSAATINVTNIDGFNSHHIAESAYKSLALALRQAITIDSKQENRIPSTKGSLKG